MAKKQKKRLPKRIAGVKVPKSVRKGRLGDAIASPDGQTTLAEVFTAAAVVAGSRTTADSGAARQALTEVADRLRGVATAKGPQKAAADDTVTYALGEAARSFVTAFDRRRAGQTKEAAASGAEAPGVAGTKRKPPIADEIQP
jgi:hypothetical protein